MIALVFSLTLHEVIFGLSPDPEVLDRVVCDDGSLAIDAEGQPNWSCGLQGCSPTESACWDFRTEGCYDEKGGDDGSCLLDVETCTGALDCFSMWALCAGAYKCHEDSTVGCEKGSCTTDSSAAEYEPD